MPHARIAHTDHRERSKDLMKSGLKATLTFFAGAALLAGAVGYGTTPAPAATTKAAPSFGVAPAHPPPAPPQSRTGGAGIGAIHGCIIGLNCGCIPHRTCGRQVLPAPLPPPPGPYGNEEHAPAGPAPAVP